MKKISALKIIALAAVLSCGAKAMASDFGLEALNAADVRAAKTDFRAADPKPAGDDDMIGIDVAVRVPYKTIKKAVGQLAEKNKDVTIIDENAPVMSKSGEFIKIDNIQVNVNGIMARPTLLLKPYLEGRDRLSIRIQRVQLHASMEPDQKAAPELDQNELMSQVMESLIKTVYAAIDAKLKPEHTQYTARDIIRMRYDKTAWTLRMAFSYRIMNQLMPPGLVGTMHLTGFTFSDTAISLKVETGE